MGLLSLAKAMQVHCPQSRLIYRLSSVSVGKSVVAFVDLGNRIAVLATATTGFVQVHLELLLLRSDGTRFFCGRRG
jgi:hypothetical protein